MDKSKMSKMMTKLFIIFSLFMLVGFNDVSAHETMTNEKGSKEEKCLTHKHEQMKIHINMYYELLAEKYAPDQVKLWQDIQKEQANLKAQIKEAKEKGELDSLKDKMKPWFKEHKEIQKQFTEAIEKRNEKQIKKLLPEIISHHQQLNELYKEILNGTN